MKNSSILIVDDEPGNFLVIEALLGNQDYQLHYAASGYEALDSLSSIQPDVILLDVMMPVLNGLEVCEKITAMPLWRAIPIIMVTALTNKEVLSRCLKAGASDYITQPVGGVELRAKVHSMLRIKHQHDDLQAALKRQESLEAEKVGFLENYNIKLVQQVEERTAILKATLEREQLVARIATQIRSSLHLQEILETTVQEVRSLLGCDYAIIWRFQADWSATVVANAIASGLPCAMGEQVYVRQFSPDWIALYLKGQIRVVTDTDAAEVEDCRQESLEKLQIRAKILVPILQGDHLWGLLSVAQRQTPRQWHPHETTLLKQLATQLAIAIQNACLFEQVRGDRERLKCLSSRLIEAQEIERRHIAYELHDEIGQALTAVKINLQASQRSLSAAGEPLALQESIAIVDGALQQVRNLALDLRPSILDDLGLLAALRWYLDRQSQRTKTPINFVCGVGQIALPPNLEMVCFRIVQEALNNIAKHAQATHVTVQLNQQQETIHLTIRDDGIGFNVEAAQRQAARGSSLGLLGMEERATLVGGELRIVSTSGKGTKINAAFPINFFMVEPP